MAGLLHRRRRAGSERIAGLDASAQEHAIVAVIVHDRDEDGFLVGEVKELGISSFGSTFEEAVAMTMDAACTHLNALEELEPGAARKFLADRGVLVHGAHADDEREPVHVAARPGESVSPRVLPVGDSLIPA